MIKLKDILLEEITYKIYCDMDGVLSDFDTKFEKLSGGISSSKYNDLYGDVKFWEVVEKGGLEFWSKMPWMKDGKKLWAFIKNKNVELLSAPSRSIPESSKGKKIWVSRELGSVKLNLVRASKKKNFAKSNAILIDDMNKNIDQWKSAGGIGILHKSAGDTIKKLRKYD